MTSSPVYNLSNFIKTKPPLIVFLICLVALAASTFYFAFDIQRNEPVTNRDKERDWVRLLRHFNQLDTCINSYTWNDEINLLEKESSRKNEISVFSKVRIENATILSGFFEVHGTLTLQGWYSTDCAEADQQPENMEIFFHIPPFNASLNNTIDVCATIKGSAKYLPFVKDSLCIPTDPPNKLNVSSKSQKGYLKSKSPKMKDSTFCENGEYGQLTFNLKRPKAEYLNDDVRTRIYVHLIWCSYFLVFVIFGILLFSIIKKSNYLEKKEQVERLL
ncbi:hypothetical protein ABEB36_007567 [Hypothenemus hampei]|uniref:TMEM248/TMEM219 domain-containing protein n=1 Tax=Hypothenemus hampei TaxID=57062 RepID=A0ABD1EUJ5_HYPHA